MCRLVMLSCPRVLARRDPVVSLARPGARGCAGQPRAAVVDVRVWPGLASVNTSCQLRSDGAHVGGSRALGPRLLVVLDLRALGERLKAATGDPGMVDEQIFALLVGRDKPKALLAAEPLHGSPGHSPSLPGWLGPGRRGR